MIQTDKPKYKPGDDVKIRIFFIHPDGTAVNETYIKNFHLEIRNNADEKLDAFSFKNFEPKVYTYIYPVSKDPLMGYYKINVWTNIADNAETNSDNEIETSEEAESSSESEFGNSENLMQPYDTFVGQFDLKKSISQNFIVEKYVLTEYSLFVETKRLVPPNSNISVKVYGLYSFGKYVIGKAEVNARMMYDGHVKTSYDASANIEANGEATILIDTVKHLNIVNSIDNYDVYITVNFVDDLSQSKLKKEVKVTIGRARNNLKLVLHPVEPFLRPGIKFKMNVHLQDIDGNFIEETSKQVILSVTKNFQLGLCDEITHDLVKDDYKKLGAKSISNSFASFEVEVPYNTTSMQFRAVYDGTVRNEFVVVRSKDIPVSRNYVNIAPRKTM